MDQVPFRSEDILCFLNFCKDLKHKHFLSTAKFVARIFGKRHKRTRKRTGPFQKIYRLFEYYESMQKTTILRHKQTKKHEYPKSKPSTKPKFIKRVSNTKKTRRINGTTERAHTLQETQEQSRFRTKLTNGFHGNTFKSEKIKEPRPLNKAEAKLHNQKRKKRRNKEEETLAGQMKAISKTKVHKTPIDSVREAYFKTLTDKGTKTEFMDHGYDADSEDIMDFPDFDLTLRIPSEELAFVVDLLHEFLEKQRFFLERIAY